MNDPTTNSGAAMDTRLLVPLALMVVTVLAMVAWQTFQLTRDHETLTTIRSNQESAVEEARRLRTQLDSIASRTAQLAASGNANAQRIIDDLRRQGVNINPSQPAPPPR